jgi:catechol 2,3-dioxygenase-like lactoylglutathione lyase family enzyme
MSALLRHVLLLQRDVPAAAAFYNKGLGLVVEVCTDAYAELSEPRGAQMGGGDAHTDRSPPSSSSPSPSPSPSLPRDGGRVVLALKRVEAEAHLTTGYSPILNFTVTDMQDTVQSLIEAGARMDGGIKYLTQGKVAAFRAPDGHMLGLFEPAEGSILAGKRPTS